MGKEHALPGGLGVINSLRVSHRAAGRTADQRAETALEGRVLLPQQFGQQHKIKTGLMESNISWVNGQGGLCPHLKAKIPVLITRPWPSKAGVGGIFCLQDKGGGEERPSHVTRASTKGYLAPSICHWVSSGAFLASDVPGRSSHSTL